MLPGRADGRRLRSQKGALTPARDESTKRGFSADTFWARSPIGTLLAARVCCSLGGPRSPAELSCLQHPSPRRLAGLHCLYVLFYEMSFIRCLNMQMWEHHLSGQTPCWSARFLPRPLHEELRSCSKRRDRWSSRGTTLLLPKRLWAAVSWG